MATIIQLSPIHTPSLRIFSSHSSQNTPSLSFYLPAKALTLPSISLKPYTTGKPRALVVTSAVKSLSETELVPVPAEADEIAGKLPANTGVYAVFDQNGELQFVGLSRNIAASVLTHRKSLPELCYSVKVWTFFWSYSFVTKGSLFVPKICVCFVVFFLLRLHVWFLFQL